MTQNTTGQLQTANHLLSHFERLSATYREDGHLFFRNALDSDAVLKAKQDFVRVLQKQGVVKAGESEPIWTGVVLDQIDDNALYALNSCQELLDLESTRCLVEGSSGSRFSCIATPTSVLHCLMMRSI